MSTVAPADVMNTTQWVTITKFCLTVLSSFTLDSWEFPPFFRCSCYVIER